MSTGRGDGTVWRRHTSDCPRVPGGRGYAPHTCRGSWAWVVDVGPDPVTGRRRQHTRSGFRTAREARADLAATRERLRFTAGRSEQVTVADWMDQWLAAKRVGRKPTTVAAYTQLVRSHIVPRLGAVRLVDLSADDVQRWVAGLTGTSAGGRYPRTVPKPVTAGTVRNAFAALRAACNLAVRRRMLVANPCWGVELPALRRTPGVAWTPAEAARFLDAVADDRLYALWHLILHAGLRRSQAVGLQWADVALDTATVAIVRADTQAGGVVHRGGTNKNGRANMIAIDAGTVAALRAWRGVQRAERLAWGAAYTVTDHVFTQENGDPLVPDAVSARWRVLVRSVGVPAIRLHDARHTHASLGLVSAGVPLVTMSRRLGHSGVGITADTYTHVDLAAQKTAAEDVAAVIRRHRADTG